MSDEYSCGVAEAEVEVSAMMARLMRYDQSKSTGVFTFGGTGTVMYAVKVGMEKAFPAVSMTGLHATQQQAVLIASDVSHYCRLTVASWLGLGQDNVIPVESTLTSEVKTAKLEEKARAAIESGKKIACIVCTMGTTDSLGMDDLEEIVRIRDRLVEDYKLDYVPQNML